MQSYAAARDAFQFVGGHHVTQRLLNPRLLAGRWHPVTWLEVSGRPWLQKPLPMIESIMLTNNRLNNLADIDPLVGPPPATVCTAHSVPVRTRRSLLPDLYLSCPPVPTSVATCAPLVL